jgi:hypothetical protein
VKKKCFAYGHFPNHRLLIIEIPLKSKILFMDQSEVDIDYFLEDEYFVQWVLHPDENSSLYWKNWISTHPEQADVITMAKQVVLSIR